MEINYGLLFIACGLPHDYNIIARSLFVNYKI